MLYFDCNGHIITIQEPLEKLWSAERVVEGLRETLDGTVAQGFPTVPFNLGI